MKKILLIDGSSLIFRAFYAIKNLTTKDGIFVNGVYGFLNMYYKAVEMTSPTHILVAFDRGSKTFRHEKFVEYKGTRDKAPNEITYQFGLLKDLLDSMNIKHIDMDNFEADDILGTVANIAQREEFSVEIFTGDRDYLQLVDESITVNLTKKGITDIKIMNVDSVFEEYGLKPKQLIDVKALQGDTSDNIPGVKGIGEKTALKLITDFENLDNLYENLDSLKGKVKENLISDKSSAYLSRMLGEICTTVPIEYSLEDFKIVEPNYDEFISKLEKLEFKSIINKYYSNVKSNSSKDVFIEIKKIEFEVFSKDFDLNLFKDDEIAIKFFSNEGYINRDKIIVGIYSKNNKRAYIVKECTLEFLDKLFNIDILKIGYDIKEEFYYLFRNNLNFNDNYEDVMILEYLNNSNKGKYNIEDVSKEFLNFDILNIDEKLGKGKSKLSFFDLDENIIFEYISQNVYCIYNLYKKFIEITDNDTFSLYNLIEKPLIKVLADMENEGVVVDSNILETLSAEYEIKCSKYENDVYNIAGEKFNINSPKQLGYILFEKMSLPILKKTKTGYSTDVEVLEKLSEEHIIADKILKYRSLKKLISTYLESLVGYIMEDGRIRTSFKQTVAATGRLSSIDPNLQNIPIRTEEGRNIRKAFIADKDCVFIDADYSQIELRVLAHLSNDKVMIESFKNGLDIHSKTASEVSKVPIEDITAEQRRNAKAVNFGIVYGISDYGLSKDLNITRKEAKEYIDGYLNTYLDIKSYMEEIVENTKRIGYVTTIFGRKREIPEIMSSNFNIRSFGERMALNTPIQGSAADIIKLSMINIYNELKKNNLKSKLILQVHDELVVECRKDEIDKVRKLLKKSMEEVCELKVPLKVDISEGENWYESK